MVIFTFFKASTVPSLVVKVLLTFSSVILAIAGHLSLHRAEAEARGVEYVSPEELARREQEEQDKLAEENRIKELKALCEKKGLNFDEEEAKYQARLAAAKAKAEAKAAKRGKK